jgi:antibiotic biosynthesis monooxygenase (ABM) superfamily enzyme
MNRRTYIQSVFAVAYAASAARAAEPPRKIELHLDLAVAPGREKEMLSNFEKIFRPTAKKQPGYVDLKMLKLRDAIRGGAPPGGTFRFVLDFESEELRQKWIASAAHAKAWPTIEDTLSDKNFNILLYDIY